MDVIGIIQAKQKRENYYAASHTHLVGGLTLYEVSVFGVLNKLLSCQVVIMAMPELVDVTKAKYPLQSTLYCTS